MSAVPSGVRCFPLGELSAAQHRVERWAGGDATTPTISHFPAGRRQQCLLRRGSRLASPIAFALFALCLLHGTAEPVWAVELQFSGRLQTDLRARVRRETVGPWYSRVELSEGISRNENIAKLRLEARGGRFLGVAEVDFVWFGLQRDTQQLGLANLSQREHVDPFRLEVHGLYLEATDLMVERLDLRLGYQRITWGKGDQFNPTNTLNANDLEDALLFGEQLANAMARLDYAFSDNWRLMAVLVPLFKPALLPKTAELGLANLDQLPFVEDPLRLRLHAERALSQRLGFGDTLDRIDAVVPEARFDNVQLGFRLAGVVAEHDLALSYYVGRHDIPQPFLNVTRSEAGRRCNPADANECLSGLLVTDVYLGYPRMQVLGLNLGGEINPLGWLSKSIQPLGYWIELGLFFPQARTLAVQQEALDLPGLPSQPAGEYDYGLGERRPLAVADTPFAKWVVGLDYTFGPRVYLNLQWVHGLADEFGAGDFLSDGVSVRSARVAGDAGDVLICATDALGPGRSCVTEVLRNRLGDYLVGGLDLTLMSERQLLLRLFAIVDLTGVAIETYDSADQTRKRRRHSPFSSEGFSAVIFPEVNYNLGHGLDLGAGALIQLGKAHTKFGDPAAGGTVVWTRGRMSF